MEEPTWKARLSRAEKILARVAGGDYSQKITIAEEDDQLTSLEMGINFLVLDLRSISEANREKEAMLLTQTRELESKLATIEYQAQTIRELSTPVIQIWDEILMLPLIGMIDTARAQQVMENLLEAVVKSGASIVIIDITGVPLVDTAVVRHLIDTTAAMQLLGAEAVLTGVSPQNASTLVKLGVDLSRVTTRGSLQSGLKLAFERTRQKPGKQ
jgi:rsbT co-antagonist protein RsbR